tara:strand:+ start:1153 stop:1356 length:204 start_codon:yes stop_codon:yes gene_type:complete
VRVDKSRSFGVVLNHSKAAMGMLQTPSFSHVPLLQKCDIRDTVVNTRGEIQPAYRSRIKIAKEEKQK